ncbi:deoxyguanosinetriphosphate triphosphohydrolase [Hyphobacterium marinum]|uniref:Deoxyguanosinetriphosphate triphosphohydrolase-like protein n=1 Tax=Hyphobacterium marinum TaxID=3116574 RepID=A0ABU7M1C7_9PROT|nr:deoxyguanosinetriphosphate triphosphohydrolase [Hyphobacterium sp. Y6023]MEE2567618.1 deoxyguanosinetriphosphate triphosphohydrolase [Hyphobacterium sp. Y6023]
MSIGATDRNRAPYANHPSRSRGRFYPQAESATRNAFQRDRDRIIHATAFRRLKEKTQVFVAHEGDHYRTRLTHSLEVSQIARTIARVLDVDEDLAEALALAHDLGHPPFGHAGERALAECMTLFGGFDHNAHTLRVITDIERRYAAFPGLNLTWETLEGVVKHNGPLINAATSEDDLPWAIRAYEDWRSLDLNTFAGVEAQIAALADDIAYNNHDIDDGLRAGLLDIDALAELPVVGPIIRDCRARFPEASEAIVTLEAVRDLIGVMVEDVLAETRKRLDAARPESAEAVRQAGLEMVAFSADMVGALAALRSHLFENMYRHYKVNRMMAQAERVIRELFALFLEDPKLLPTSYRLRAGEPGSQELARLVCDYIAGMTDRYALEEHRRLFTVQGYF